MDWPKRIKRPSRKALLWTGGGVLAVLTAVILFLGLFDWNYFKGPISRYASAQAGRQISIDGDLDVHILSWTPSARIEGLRIANPGWVGAGDMARIRKLEVEVKLMPLFRGQVILPLLRVDQPEISLIRDDKGRNNWTFKGKSPGEPTRLPPIRRFEINDGKLSIDDRQRRMVFNGTVSSSEVVGAQTVQGFKLRGDGTLNREPFKLDLTGGPLLNVDPKRPYPFDADVRAGATHVVAKGAIPKPFDLARFDTSLMVSGADLAHLYYLTGLTLPNTPPYRVNGRLSRRGQTYEYKNLTGSVGDSDLRGQVLVRTGQRLFLQADLSSRLLDFDDLAAVLGGPPARGRGETASPEQVQMGQQMAAQQRLLPDAKLNVGRLRTMDAQVKYRAASVRASRFPVRTAAVDLKLDKGFLTLDPVSFGFPAGRLGGRVALNARQDTPSVDLDLRLTGARVEQFMPARGGAQAIQGGLVGRARLSGRGLSVRQVASNAGGNVTVVVPRGEIRKALAELLGINVTRGLGLLLSENQERTEIRCGVADFQARGGVLQARRLLLDTGPVLAQGGGTIDLRNEQVNIRLKGEAKEFRLVRLMAPVTVRGPLTGPKIGVDVGEATGQVGFAAVIGAVLAPLATILPFVDPGLADDANCAALVGQAGRPAQAAKR